jgi:hypothetical protein
MEFALGEDVDVVVGCGWVEFVCERATRRLRLGEGRVEDTFDPVTLACIRKVVIKSRERLILIQTQGDHSNDNPNAAVI